MSSRIKFSLDNDSVGWSFWSLRVGVDLRWGKIVQKTKKLLRSISLSRLFHYPSMKSAEKFSYGKGRRVRFIACRSNRTLEGWNFARIPGQEGVQVCQCNRAKSNRTNWLQVNQQRRREPGGSRRVAHTRRVPPFSPLWASPQRTTLSHPFFSLPPRIAIAAY